MFGKQSNSKKLEYSGVCSKNVIQTAAVLVVRLLISQSGGFNKAKALETATLSGQWHPKLLITRYPRIARDVLHRDEMGALVNQHYISSSV